MKLQRQTKTPQEWTKVSYLGAIPMTNIVIIAMVVFTIEHILYKLTVLSLLGHGAVAMSTIVASQMIATMMALGIFDILGENHRRYLREKVKSRI